MTDPHDHEPEPDEASSTTDDAELEAMRRERDQLQDQLKRSLADLANVRRRQLQELERAQAAVLEGLAGELLPVLDHFDSALAAHAEGSDPASLVQGLRMVRTLLADALARHGLREVHAHGVPFDPNVHEAVGIDARSDVAEGHVAQVLQRGYHLGDRLLRASRVLVKGPAAPKADP